MKKLPPESVRECVERDLCTCEAFGFGPAWQELFGCSTCSDADSQARVCRTCVSLYHDGHSTSVKGRTWAFAAAPLESRRVHVM